MIIRLKENKIFLSFMKSVYWQKQMKHIIENLLVNLVKLADTFNRMKYI